ncbi:hypothetical protein [Legionella fallonii]|uniref:Uncharacterized protein n=1 Tax=Legionella fallonii LLAP-10 TaxID=1212491 RepID=A0A098G314_9GAMM|nr:hypothetical protein [Legionella fallonii]CEG56872.1 protein of unknown function [Legionella fallonii LLAP-10]
MSDPLSITVAAIVSFSVPIYLIFESLIRGEQENPVQENPVQENPVQENPVQENPVQENPVQENPVQENPLVKMLHATVLPPEVAPLSEKECHAMRRVINSDSSSKILNRLKGRMMQYEDYEKRLSLLKSALESNTSLEDGDELIPHTDINNPVLFCKEYYSNKQWKVAPASPKILDKTTLLSMLESGTHYTTRESLENPPRYKKKKPTRFRWYDYNGRSYELERMAQSLRDDLSNIVEADTNNNSIRPLTLI